MELVVYAFAAGIGMVILPSPNSQLPRQFGVGVQVVALPFLSCHPEFAVQSFLGSDSRLGLHQDSEVVPGCGIWFGGVGDMEY